MIFSRGSPDLLGKVGRNQSRLDDRLARHLLRRHRRIVVLIVVHQPGQEFLVERAPVDADAHRLVVADRRLDNGRELAVLLLAKADIARIDAVFGQSLRAGRMIGQQFVADVMEIADQRNIETEPFETVADLRHGGCAFVAVDRDAHDLRAGTIEGCNLCDRGIDVCRIGVGHRLHDDGGVTADDNAADIDADGTAAREG